MTDAIMLSAILISLALVFYSIDVWSERLAGRLSYTCTGLLAHPQPTVIVT